MPNNPNFSYQPGVSLSGCVNPRRVEAPGYDRGTRQPLAWRCGQAFLAAGTIATTGILLRSLAAYDQPVWLKDSQYFLMPLLLFRKVRGATRERLHALSQAFIEIADPAGRGPTAHIQIYTNNDLISQAVAKTFGPLQRPLGFVVRDLQERMLVAQGFIHSRHSSRIAVCLKKDQATGTRAPGTPRGVEPRGQAASAKTGVPTLQTSPADRGDAAAADAQDRRARSQLPQRRQLSDEHGAAGFSNRPPRAVTRLEKSPRGGRHRVPQHSRNDHHLLGHGQRAPDRAGSRTAGAVTAVAAFPLPPPASASSTFCPHRRCLAGGTPEEPRRVPGVHRVTI